MPRKPVPCAICGGPMQLGSTSLPAGQAAHNRCRSTHGTASRYRSGCRCRPCRDAVAEKQRRYAAKRVAGGWPMPRSTRSARCGQCDRSFVARVDTRARFCSLDCANDAQGRSESPRSAFKVSRSVRLSIFEAAGWQCQLCQALTRPDEDYNHPRYPTLDHVVPRSRGGSDDASNLRLACRQCNVLRGSNEDWVPEVTDEPVGRLAAAV